MHTRNILATLLAIVMIASLALTSCQKVTQKQVENDPAGENAEALGNTLRSVGDSFAPVAEPLESLKESGSVEITWKNDDIGVDLVGDIAYAVNEKAFSGDLSAKFGDSSASLKVSGTNDKLAVSSLELWDGTYGVDLSSIVDDIRASELLEGADRDEIADAVQAMLDLRDKLSAADYGTLGEKFADMKAKLVAAVNLAPHTVEKKEISTIGQTAKAIVTTFTFADADLCNLIGIVCDGCRDISDDLKGRLDEFDLESFGIDAEDIPEFDSFIDDLEEIAKEIDDENVGATLVVSLDPKSAELMKIEFSLEAEDGVIAGELDLGPGVSDFDKITGFIKYSSDDGYFDSEERAEFTFTRRNDLGSFVEELEVKITEKDESSYEGEEYTMNVTSSDENTLKLTFEHDKKEKTYDLDFSIVSDYSSETMLNGETSTDSDRTEGSLHLSGAFEYDRNSLTVGFDTLTAKNDEGEHDIFKGLGLTLKIKSGGAVESVPEFKEIIKLGQDEAEKLAEEISENARAMAKDVEDLMYAMEEYFDLDFGGYDMPDVYDY